MALFRSYQKGEWSYTNKTASRKTKQEGVNHVKNHLKQSKNTISNRETTIKNS
ncbi:hypothetical protein ACFSKL_04095 [Belliella marina]|uniref:DUF1508 domain-containing protein n=1 Tax=Belliella marina TaxID=1644146 RepID=A0ABW4VL15_9BACT